VRSADMRIRGIVGEPAAVVCELVHSWPTAARSSHLSSGGDRLSWPRVWSRASLLRPASRAAEPIAKAEIKATLARSSAQLWSCHPLWECACDIEQMNPDFQRVLARLLLVFMPT
jgi:hypothetical protein